MGMKIIHTHSLLQKKNQPCSEIRQFIHSVTDCACMISQSGLAATEFYQEMSGEHKVVNADSTHGALSTYFL